ncbi:CaiB/BaiF CoA transferase family protein [Halomarina halobia]|uniref:CaiB/BaiF CoA transferase family protein n=1 Tax=Halomarina halobia TaxID=3033386 RepID=A0ABD6ABP6_9EURY|nr:CoA transferase [Halomarina sp. PSR21]
MADRPLDGVRVVELSTMVAGPYAGQLLGDLGADVVKLERPDGGELARRLDPRVGGESFYYLTANRNKRSLALDVTSDAGREAFFDLVERADVVLENFPPSFTRRYGIDHGAVRERNERIVYCSISAYGETGPYRDDPGIDTTVQALTGAMSMTRDADGPPMRSGVPMNDVFAALYAVQGVLAALYDRDRTGVGDHVDVSLLDAGVTGLTTRATYSLVTGEPYPPFGRRHNYFAPEGVYAVGDGEVQLSVVTDRHWLRLCEVLDDPDLAADERFADVNERVRNRERLAAELAPRLAAWSVEDLVAALREAGVPAAPINDTRSVWDHPQVRARDLKRTVEHPTAGAVETLGFPVKYDRIEPTIRRHPPLLGEHTAEVLEELGYDPATIGDLIESGVAARHRE